LNLIEKIQDDILNPSIRLSSVLRKAKVLAYRLQNAEFKDWVDQELSGYTCDRDLLPDYRKANCLSFGNFVRRFAQVKSVAIPTYCLPDELREFATTLTFFEGIRALESIMESETESFNYPWPAEYAMVLENAVYEDMTCLAAWKPVSQAQIEQVLDTVRNRLLNFVLELEQIQPDIGEISPGEQPPIANDRVKQVFNTYVLGNYSVVSPGTSSFQGDFDMSDTFNMSGDFRGAILNIKSTLTDVKQNIGKIPNADPSAKDELKRLIGQLSEALQKVPPEKDEEAEAVAKSAKLLVDEVAKDKPNKTMVQISADGLKQAAKNIAEVMPIVLSIATQIVTTIKKFAG
jgi:hypothetical protein